MNIQDSVTCVENLDIHVYKHPSYMGNLEAPLRWVSVNTWSTCCRPYWPVLDRLVGRLLVDMPAWSLILADRWSSYWPTFGWTDGQHIDCIMADISTASVAQLVCWPIFISQHVDQRGQLHSAEILLVLGKLFFCSYYFLATQISVLQAAIFKAFWQLWPVQCKKMAGACVCVCFEAILNKVVQKCLLHRLVSLQVFFV